MQLVECRNHTYISSRNELGEIATEICPRKWCQVYFYLDFVSQDKRGKDSISGLTKSKDFVSQEKQETS